jgi:hypothetical protein
VVEHHGGGILALFNILKEHWGAVERDLQACGYTINDVITDRMPLSGFVHFVVYAPVGTAIFHMVNEGWTADTHQLTSLLDVASTAVLEPLEDEGRAGEVPDEKHAVVIPPRLEDPPPG